MSIRQSLTLMAAMVATHVRVALVASAIVVFSALAPTAAAAPPAPGVIAVSDPAIVAQGTLIHLFVRGADGLLWHSLWTGRGQAAYQSLGGPVLGGAAAASLGPGHLDVFVRGLDNALYHRVLASGQWSGWVRIAADVTSDPAVVTPDRGRMDLFVRGRDRALYHRQWSRQTGWQSWEGLGGPVLGGAAAASLGPGHLDVFVRGLDNALYHRVLASGRWSGWVRIADDVTADPGATSNVSGSRVGTEIYLFARGRDGVLSQRRWTSQTGWTPWASTGYEPTGGPDAAWAGTLMVVARGTGNAVYYKQGVGATGWQKWADAAR